MTQLQQFLFELSFGQTRRIREYMLKRYNAYCGSMKDLEQAINDYRQERQRSWMGHCDYVYLWTGSERINLTRMPKDERNKLLKQFNIPK